MKLHFESDLDYQLAAIESVCDLFRGQEVCRTEFTVTMRPPGQPQVQENLFPTNKPVQLSFGLEELGLGIGNRLTLCDEAILKNLQEVQIRNGLRPSEDLASGDFTVEMETGTGKTYVYLRMVFELNRRYGFTKFVVVVPSVAIKEGVYKSLQIMEEHFRALYSNTPFDYFIYDSGKLGQVRNFATSSNIQIMVVTVGAINKKDVNNLYKDSEKIGGEKPIDLIRATRPILIVDEPQSVDGGLEGRGKEALGAMNPLCTLRYSATHMDKHHMVFRLDAVDALQKGLVKQIEVAGARIEGAHNSPYVRLLAVSSKKNVISAKVELDVETKSGVRRKEVTVLSGDDLKGTANRAIYENFLVGEIRTAKRNEFMELKLPDGGVKYLRLGEAHGDVDALAVKRQMISRTIREHLDKEMRLRPQQIKVLSLFFIDSVEKYRKYDADGNPVKGEYAKIFEEEYRRLAGFPDYSRLFQGTESQVPVSEVHNGYFSIDRKKIGDKSVEVFKDTSGDTKADDSTYNLIMREKEKLLSLETPLKFIFSHSALKEGWDNPNVFQICALREMGSERERRQTVGRGLRLCVNHEGDRLRDSGINKLTVIANEGYEEFAENLQKEIEADTGIRFGYVEKHQFAIIRVKADDGTIQPIGVQKSEELWSHLQSSGYMDANGKIQDALKIAIKEDTLNVPEEFKDQIGQIKEILRKLSGRLEIKNADERVQVKTRQAVLHGAEFKALWDRIKHKTTYHVEFDNQKLIDSCIRAIKDAPPIQRTILQWRKADISIGRSGVEAVETSSSDTVAIVEENIELPDIVTDLQDKTKLTRRSVVQILSESDRLGDFKRNPQKFIELAAEVINRSKRLAIVDGIKYQRLGDEEYYAQELFEAKELTGYLKNMLRDTKKSVFEHVIYDSETESAFASELEKNKAVKVYAKLPGWFQVPTPLGQYNPDWAVLVEKDGQERLYFVVETKSSLLMSDLREIERAKIKCGHAHFNALATGDNPAKFVTAKTLNDVLVV